MDETNEELLKMAEYLHAFVNGVTAHNDASITTNAEAYSWALLRHMRELNGLDWEGNKRKGGDGA